MLIIDHVSSELISGIQRNLPFLCLCVRMSAQKKLFVNYFVEPLMSVHTKKGYKEIHFHIFHKPRNHNQELNKGKTLQTNHCTTTDHPCSASLKPCFATLILSLGCCNVGGLGFARCRQCGYHISGPQIHGTYLQTLNNQGTYSQFPSK